MTFRNKGVIALIPARAGSKGVPQKNLRMLGGKPLTVHTLQAAISCEAIDHVVLSSDSEEILNLAPKHGAYFHRRANFASGDNATASDVVSEFITNARSVEVRHDSYIVYLQPTSPFRTSTHLKAAFEIMETTGCETCVSVVKMNQNPYKSFTLDANYRLQSLFGESRATENRQSLPPVYYPNGAIYIFPVCRFLETGIFPMNGSVPLVMSELHSLDIDSQQDFKRAESLWRLSLS